MKIGTENTEATANKKRLRKTNWVSFLLRSFSVVSMSSVANFFAFLRRVRCSVPSCYHLLESPCFLQTDVHLHYVGRQSRTRHRSSCTRERLVFPIRDWRKDSDKW